MAPSTEKSSALTVVGVGVVLAVVALTITGYVPLFLGTPVSSTSQFDGYCDGVVTFASQGPPPSSGNLTCADIADEEVRAAPPLADYLLFTGFACTLQHRTADFVPMRRRPRRQSPMAAG